MNKTALITGASSGIGASTARQLAEKGIRLILCGRRKERLDQLAAELEGKSEVLELVFDVRNNSEVVDAISSLPDSWKQIDVLVNNAGGAHGLDLLEDGSLEDWDNMIDSNVKGLLYVSKAVLPLMIAQNKGHIINVGSIAGKQTYARGTVYCAAKSGVEAISKGMRLELVPKGIKVTNIAPGAVETEFSIVRFKGDVDRANAVYQGYSPLTADDVARCIEFAATCPEHVQIADMTIFPSAQSDATTIHRTSLT